MSQACGLDTVLAPWRTQLSLCPFSQVLVAFDHPIFTPFDVLFVEEDACDPIRSAFRVLCI